MARRGLVGVLCLDGAGVCAYTILAAVGREPAMVALAAAAAGGWLLALAAAVLALAPEAASASTVLLTAGIAVGLCYLLLLRRLPEHRRHA
ncbi:MAG TPA: hypothetical protein VNR36_10190 [Pseudolysinimonas sp.]|nr:hypothetical protein [Pseudolysinimonas sp.]